jgi:hypothetical protein
MQKLLKKAGRQIIPVNYARLFALFLERLALFQGQ